jgi:hypothetical protein
MQRLLSSDTAAIKEGKISVFCGTGLWVEEITVSV